ncbi:hypothetical protein AV530_013276 [Patagioenas fasciata monilis]|uniref:Uncharacterized protein n=1 Tax=Patagioenas fasciata monilis TaxID=372326 RepID=A0A1V4JP00_PATFA|nr:hypothetical protein AV530_013276 [Patagioenas fasciata monilis]
MEHVQQDSDHCFICRKGVIDKEGGKAEADCISCAEQHGQTHPIHSIDRRSAQNLIWKREKDLKGVDTFDYEDEYEKNF